MTGPSSAPATQAENLAPARCFLHRLPLELKQRVARDSLGAGAGMQRVIAGNVILVAGEGPAAPASIALPTPARAERRALWALRQVDRGWNAIVKSLWPDLVKQAVADAVARGQSRFATAEERQAWLADTASLALHGSRAAVHRKHAWPDAASLRQAENLRLLAYRTRGNLQRLRALQIEELPLTALQLSFDAPLASVALDKLTLPLPAALVHLDLRCVQLLAPAWAQLLHNLPPLLQTLLVAQSRKNDHDGRQDEQVACRSVGSVQLVDVQLAYGRMPQKWASCLLAPQQKLTRVLLRNIDTAKPTPVAETLDALGAAVREAVLVHFCAQDTAQIPALGRKRGQGLHVLRLFDCTAAWHTHRDPFGSAGAQLHSLSLHRVHFATNAFALLCGALPSQLQRLSVVDATFAQAQEWQLCWLPFLQGLPAKLDALTWRHRHLATPQTGPATLAWPPMLQVLTLELGEVGALDYPLYLRDSPASLRFITVVGSALTRAAQGELQALVPHAKIDWPLA